MQRYVIGDPPCRYENGRGKRDLASTCAPRALGENECWEGLAGPPGVLPPAPFTIVISFYQVSVRALKKKQEQPSIRGRGLSSSSWVPLSVERLALDSWLAERIFKRKQKVFAPPSLAERRAAG